MVGDTEMEANPARVCAMVLGVHRSGTSALARTLSLVGCDLPKTLVPPTSGNEAGHWESQAICRLNDELLESAGTDWHDWQVFNEDWRRSPKAAEFKKRAIGALHDEYGSSHLFVLKDPRIARMTGFWIDALKSFGARPAIFFIVRNPIEVAESLKKRDGFDTSLGQLLWLRNILDAEHESRDVRRYVLSYETLLSDWGRVLKESQGALDVVWPRKPSLVTPEIGQFLSAKLQHHRASPQSVLNNEQVSEWVRAAFRIFDRWSREGEDRADRPELDGIRAEMNATAPAFARLIALGGYHKNQAARLEKKLGEIESKASQTEKELDALRAKAAATESALRQRSHESEQVALDLAGAKKQLDAAQSANGKLSAEIAEATRRLDAAQSANGKLSAEFAEATRRLDAARSANEKLTAELAEQKRLTMESDAAREALGRKLVEQENAAKQERQEHQRATSDFSARIAARFGEIATLTRLAVEKESVVTQMAADTARTTERMQSMLKSVFGRPWFPVFRARQLARRAALLNATGVFDAEYYLEANKDVCEAGVDPARHFVEFGLAEGRPPNREIGRALGRG